MNWTLGGTHKTHDEYGWRTMSEAEWFKDICDSVGKYLVNKEDTVPVERWHAKDVRDNPLLLTREILNLSFDLAVPDSVGEWKDVTKPNLPWAEDHFQERVSGIPHNPPPSHAWWPWSSANAKHQDENQKFSHTYPERFWNKGPGITPRWGIRYPYGDLQDLVDLMKREPLTRQAYLPVWFPEDTGDVHGERVPCTLGYHFLTRDGVTRVNYFIRSCDFVRYFRDDVYMAGRLLQWLCEQIHTKPYRLYFTCVSMHIMQGDVPKLRKEYDATAIS